VQPWGELVGDERDRVAAEQAAGGRHPEHQVAPARTGELPDRAGLPEQRATAGGRGRGRARDGAAVAAEHQVDAALGQGLDRSRGGVGLRHVDLVQDDRAAAHPAVLVGELGGDLDPVVLVDAAHALGAAQRVDGADADRLGPVAAAAGAGSQQQGEQAAERAQVSHVRAPVKYPRRACFRWQGGAPHTNAAPILDRHSRSPPGGWPPRG
jgi:hypothetical protein